MARWDSVEAFVSVVQHGGFSAAARVTGASPSYLSRAVSQLETRLGMQLLYRTTRQIRLTDSGRRYFEDCRELIAGLEAAERSAQALEAAPRGHLRLSCATHFGERYVAPALNDFLLRHPQVSAELTLTNRMVNLIDEGFDLAIRLGTLRDSSLVARRLAPRRLYVCAAPGYVERQGAPGSLDELAGHHCLVGSTDYWTFSVGGQREDRRVRGRLRCNSGPALLDAALKGLGLAQLPENYVLTHLDRGDLVEVLGEHAYAQAGVYAVYPWSRYPVPKVRALVAFLVERFAGRAPWSR
ncbi:LysR family transcriptional regulator [Arhodomonas sp. AD133]|uniref:LysR family transcriptional regulator n=1 Tax=Arhodomonas sp. AD133 TaxID=3415009 RepID=UPI003EB8B238